MRLGGVPVDSVGDCMKADLETAVFLADGLELLTSPDGAVSK
jgi:hypothetical protein